MPDFFLVVCRSRKRYALYLILLPKFHQISATLKPLTLGVSLLPSPRIFPPNPISQASFSNSVFFLWCPLCFNALTSLQAEGGYRSIWTCCRKCRFFVFAVVGVPRPSAHPPPHLTSYLTFSVFLSLCPVYFSHFQFLSQCLPSCDPAKLELCRPDYFTHSKSPPGGAVTEFVRRPQTWLRSVRPLRSQSNPGASR